METKMLREFRLRDVTLTERERAIIEICALVAEQESIIRDMTNASRQVSDNIRRLYR